MLPDANGKPDTVDRRNYDAKHKENSVSGYFSNNNEALFPSGIGSTHTFKDPNTASPSINNINIHTTERDKVK